VVAVLGTPPASRDVTLVAVRVQFVDCRWELGRSETGRELYLAGHVPGASFLDVEHDLSAPPSEHGRHPLPAADDFAAAAGRAGIGAGVLVVAYDQGRTGGAARLWWLLRHFGHDDVAVLDGGIGAWLGPLRAGEEEVEPATFVPAERSDDVVAADELLALLDDPRLTVVDARAPERYRGEVEPLDPVAGHIPGATNVPFANCSERLDELVGAEELVVYCGSGITACVNLLALAHAGRADAKLYPGSWSEWSRQGLPASTDVG
jgi:thiosulfate/3-mercaptopyruvate sulfurtransferase